MLANIETISDKSVKDIKLSVLVDHPASCLHSGCQRYFYSSMLVSQEDSNHTAKAVNVNLCSMLSKEHIFTFVFGEQLRPNLRQDFDYTGATAATQGNFLA